MANESFSGNSPGATNPCTHQPIQAGDTAWYTCGYMHMNQNSLVEFRSDNAACLCLLFHSVPYPLPLNTTLKCVCSVESDEFQM